jgi:methylglyoxal reductase
VIHDGLAPIRDRFGATPAELAPVMLAYCLHRAGNAAVLAGFTTPEQVRQNLAPPGHPLTEEDLAFILDSTGVIQRRLDASGEVFTDELPVAQP